MRPGALCCIVGTDITNVGGQSHSLGRGEMRLRGRRREAETTQTHTLKILGERQTRGQQLDYMEPRGGTSMRFLAGDGDPNGLPSAVRSPHRGAPTATGFLAGRGPGAASTSVPDPCICCCLDYFLNKGVQNLLGRPLSLCSTLKLASPSAFVPNHLIPESPLCE